MRGYTTFLGSLAPRNSFNGAKRLSAQCRIRRGVGDRPAASLAVVLYFLAVAGQAQGQAAVNGRVTGSPKLRLSLTDNQYFQAPFDVGNGQRSIAEAGLRPLPFAPPVPTSATQAQTTTKVPPQADKNDPMTPHDPGIYCVQQNEGGRRMISLDPEPLAVTAGKVKWKAAVNGAQAPTRVQGTRPTFYFYLPSDQEGFPGVPSGGSFAMSPRAFVLVHLESKKTEREIPLDKANINTGGRGSRISYPDRVQANRPANVRQKDQVPFAFDKVATGIYKVQPDSELEAGEYGFLYSGSLQMPEGRLFDFGIEAAK